MIPVIFNQVPTHVQSVRLWLLACVISTKNGHIWTIWYSCRWFMFALVTTYPNMICYDYRYLLWTEHEIYVNFSFIILPHSTMVPKTQISPLEQAIKKYQHSQSDLARCCLVLRLSYSTKCVIMIIQWSHKNNKAELHVV